MHLTDRLAFARRYARVAVVERRQDIGHCIAPAPHRPDPAAWPDDRLTVSWLGHATVLLNVLGTSVVTDPVLERRIGLGRGVVKLGPRRLIQPALRKRELPRLDAVLLSHAHMDHTDLGTLRAIPAGVRVVVQSGNRDLVRRFHAVDELAWGETTRIGDLEVESIETRHWGARMVTDRHRGWGGYLLRKSRPHRAVRRRHGLHRCPVAAPAARPDRSRHPADRGVRPVGDEPRLPRGGMADVPGRSAPTTCSRSTTPPSASAGSRWTSRSGVSSPQPDGRGTGW